MKKLSLLGMVLGAAVYSTSASAIAVYSSDTNSYLDQFSDSGPTASSININIGDSSYGAQAAVNGTEVKSMSYLDGSYGGLFNNASSGASFTQYFQASSAGQATISFGWDGTLESDGMTEAGYEFEAYKNDEENVIYAYDSVGGSNQNEDSIIVSSSNVDRTQTMIFQVEENEIFGITVSLQTWVYAYGGECGLNCAVPDTAEDGYQSVYGVADFFNTGSITGFSSNVSAVPVPAAVWLFGSAIAFLGMNRRKKVIA